jgi:hypothetical protein
VIYLEGRINISGQADRVDSLRAINLAHGVNPFIEIMDGDDTSLSLLSQYVPPSNNLVARPRRLMVPSETCANAQNG